MAGQVTTLKINVTYRAFNDMVYQNTADMLIETLSLLRCYNDIECGGVCLKGEIKDLIRTPVELFARHGFAGLGKKSVKEKENAKKSGFRLVNMQ